MKTKKENEEKIKRAMVLGLFDNKKEVILYEYMRDELSNHYERPDRIIRDFINERYLQIDSLSPDFYIGLTVYGIRIWEELY